MKRDIKISVNARESVLRVEEERTLLDVVREELGLTGTKYGCGEGQCGACTVLIDGRAARSCITTIAEAEGKSVLTIEGLAADGKLHPVQQAFVDEGAMQCGFCVPGQILAAVALFDESPQPSRKQIVETLSGNLCRCCNYPSILAAVERAAKAEATGGKPSAGR